MEKIKVYLQYPWKFPDSPYYKYLVDNPPKNIEFLNAERQKGVIINKKIFWFSNFLKRNIRRLTNKLNLSIPNAHLTKTKEKYDIIHCAHCLSKNKGKSWIMDIESEWQLYVGNKTKKAKERIEKILMNKNCKKIMPWTQTTANRIIEEFPEIEDKIEVVYPAVPVQKIKRKKHKGINLLFVGRYFYEKGGLHVLKVINKLTEKYENVRAIIISEIPEKIHAEYSHNKKIELYGLMPQKELFELYSKSDIFIYPGYSDSFGFAYLETLGFGIPIITVDGFARKEIINEGKTGFIVNKFEEINPKIIGPKEEQLINEITKKSEELIENPILRKKMSKNCIQIIKNGKFSIKERNKKLERIYEGLR